MLRIYVEHSNKIDINIKEFLPYLSVEKIIESIKDICWDHFFNIHAFSYPVNCDASIKNSGLAWREKNILEITFPISSDIGFQNLKKLNMALDIINYRLNDEIYYKEKD